VADMSLSVAVINSLHSNKLELYCQAAMTTDKCLFIC